MIAKRVTRRALVSGVIVAGAGAAMRMSAVGARQTPVSDVAPGTFAMRGADPANTAWVPGPALDGMPELGERLLVEVSFTLAFVEEAGLLARDGVLYACGRSDHGPSALYAIDASTGDERWRALSVDALLAISPNAVITQRLGRDGAPDLVIAFDLETGGEELWQVEARAQGRTVVVDDAVLASTSDGPILLDAGSGDRIWERAEPSPSVPLETAVGDGIVVGTQPTSASRVGAWRLDSGEPLWSVELERPVQTAPVVSGDVVLVCDPLELVELDLQTGEERRRIALPWSVPYRGRLVLAGSTLIVSDTSGLIAIDLDAGQTTWQYVPHYGTAYEIQAAGDQVFLLTQEDTSHDAGQVLEAIDLASGEPLYELPARGSEDADDDLRMFVVTDGRIVLGGTEGLRIAEFTGEPYAGISSPVRGNTFASESAGFSYTWTDDWVPGNTDWLLGEDGLRFQSTDRQALVTQYVEDIEEPLSLDEMAWAIAGVPPGGDLSLDPAPLVVAFPRTFGPDTSRLRGLEAADPPDLSGTVPSGSGVAQVLAHTILSPPFDRMLVLIVAVPLRDAGSAIVFEFATAADGFDAWLPAFLTFFDHLAIR